MLGSNNNQVLFLYMHEGKIGIGKYGSFVKENQKAKLK